MSIGDGICLCSFNYILLFSELEKVHASSPPFIVRVRNKKWSDLRINLA